MNFLQFCMKQDHTKIKIERIINLSYTTETHRNIHVSEDDIQQQAKQKTSASSLEDKQVQNYSF